MNYLLLQRYKAIISSLFKLKLAIQSQILLQYKVAKLNFFIVLVKYKVTKLNYLIKQKNVYLYIDKKLLKI